METPIFKEKETLANFMDDASWTKLETKTPFHLTFQQEKSLKTFQMEKPSLIIYLKQKTLPFILTKISPTKRKNGQRSPQLYKLHIDRGDHGPPHQNLPQSSICRASLSKTRQIALEPSDKEPLLRQSKNR